MTGRKRGRDEYRRIEQRLWESVGLSPSERDLGLASCATVRIQEVGEGPPVVFVHGGTSSGANWAPLIAALEGLHCIVLDRPGCGLSAPIAAPFEAMDAFDEFADALVPEVIDALGLSRASVVATSFGAYFAIRGAAAQSESISRLICVAYPFGARMVKAPRSMRFATIPGMASLSSRIPPNRPAVRMILKQLGLGRALAQGKVSDEFFEWFLSLLRDTDTMRNEIRASPKLLTPIRGQNPDTILRPDTLARVTVPTLFAWGEDDPIGGADVAEPFVAQFPDASLEMIPESGHAPWVDEPALVARLIEDFVVGDSAGHRPPPTNEE